MTLNTETRSPEAATADRTRLVEDLLDQMTPWNPEERLSAFRSFLVGSLSLVHIHVLTILELQGPLSMTRLAEELDVSVASATGIVNRMEERGLVERRHGDTDRRVVSVQPTRAGGEVFERLHRRRRQKLRKLLGQLSDFELQAFLTGLSAMRRARTAIAAEATTDDAEGAE
ncbi:MAG: MarR family winged helix-turn-helix transcriptional regulator [Chloroflexota bacterium]